MRKIKKSIRNQNEKCNKIHRPPPSAPPLSQLCIEPDTRLKLPERERKSLNLILEKDEEEPYIYCSKNENQIGHNDSQLDTIRETIDVFLQCCLIFDGCMLSVNIRNSSYSEDRN